MDVYLGYGTERYGPYTPEEVRTHYKSRDLAADYWVWHEGLTNWIPVAEFLSRQFASGAINPADHDWIPTGAPANPEELTHSRLQRITDRIAFTRKIYIYQDHEQLGPYPIQELEQKLSEGTLRVDSAMWFNGLENWVHLGKCMEHYRKTKNFTNLPPQIMNSMPSLPRVSPRDRIRVTQKFARRGKPADPAASSPTP